MTSATRRKAVLLQLQCWGIRIPCQFPKEAEKGQKCSSVRTDCYQELRSSRRTSISEGRDVRQNAKKIWYTNQLKFGTYMGKNCTVQLEFEFHLSTYCTVVKLATVATIHFCVHMEIFDLSYANQQRWIGRQQHINVETNNRCTSKMTTAERLSTQIIGRQKHCNAYLPGIVFQTLKSVFRLLRPFWMHDPIVKMVWWCLCTRLAELQK